MTTIKVVNSNGMVGRCDARCHEAKTPDCHCICGGAFHGIGSEAAREDRFDLTDSEILEDRPNCRVFRAPEQKNLFD